VTVVTDCPTEQVFSAPRNVLIVAMANKLARITWAVLSSGNPYRAVAAA